MKKFSLLPCVLLVGTGFLLNGCSGGRSDSSRTSFGQRISVAEGSARSFYQANSDGSPAAVGISFDQRALDSLSAPVADKIPVRTGMRQSAVCMTKPAAVQLEGAVFTFELPEKADGKTVVDHITLDWNPSGHEPDFVYGNPHFDAHFYTVSQAERTNISPVDADVPAPNPSTVPPDYTSGVQGVPGMGVHYVDQTGEEWVPQPKLFTQNFIYGYYKGDLTFLEPMFSVDFLNTKPDFSADIKQAPEVEESGYYPTKYNIRYDAATKSYQVYLSNFVYRTPSIQ